MSQRKRETCLALVILTLTTLCCFHKLVEHPQSVLVGPQNRGANDLTNYYIPSREYAARTIHEFGEFPFWNPYVCLGLPYTGNPQSALYYPPNWLCHVWPARLILSWLLVAHHLFAGAGVYCLARRYGLGWSGSVMGGMVFLAAPFLVAQSAEGHYAQVAAVAWAPWAFLAYESVREGSRRAGALLALCLAMSFFCGHAQETYYLVLLLTGLAATDAGLMYHSGRRADCGRLLVNWVRIGFYTAGIVAVDLLPSFISSRMSLRPSLEQLEGDFGWASFHVENLLELLNPFALTRPELWETGTTPYWEKVCHFGIVPLVLATSAVFVGWNRRPTRQMASLWVLTLLFAFGTNGPVYSALAEVVPGLSWFRLPSRILFFTSLATSVLAGVGVDEFVRRVQAGHKESWQFVGVTGVVTFGLLVGWYALYIRLTGTDTGPLELHPESIAWLCAPALVTLIALARPGLLRPVVVGVLLAVCVADLTHFARQVTATATISSLDVRDEHLLALLCDDSIETPGRVVAFQDIVSDGDAYQYGLRKVRGYDPAGPADYLLLLHRLSLPDCPAPEPMGFLPLRVTDLRKNLLDLLGVRHVVQLQAEDPGPESLADWTRVHAGVIPERMNVRGASEPPLRYVYEVLRNETPLPRAFVVGTARELSTWAEFDAAAGDTDFRREVILNRDVLPAGPRSGYREARVLETARNRIVIAAELDAAGYLVVSDLWFPGWRAQVNGQSVKPLRANMAFRAIPLPVGRHEVTISFHPPGLVTGASVSAAALLYLISSLLTGRTLVRKGDDAGIRTVRTTTSEEDVAEAATVL